MIYYTKGEALCRARTWAGKYPGQPGCPESWDRLEWPGMNVDQEIYEGNDGLIVVIPHGDDTEGAVVAIREYSADTKTYRWQNESARE